MAKHFQTYQDFWPFYVSQHRNRLCRNLHFLGTSLVLLMLVLAVMNLNAWLLLAMPVFGYGFAWVGHFYAEKNRPATFTYPIWSLMGDFQMFYFMCQGRMDEEVRRVQNS